MFPKTALAGATAPLCQGCTDPGGGDIPSAPRMWCSDVLLPGAPGTEPRLPGCYSLSALIFPKASLSFYFQEKYGPKFVIFDSAPKTCASFRELQSRSKSLPEKVPFLKCWRK